MLITSDNRKWFKFVNCQFFFVFTAKQLILVPAPVPHGIELQNPHPTDVHFSWLRHNPRLKCHKVKEVHKCPSLQKSDVKGVQEGSQ